MQARIDQFRRNFNHPWLGRIAKRLSASEVELAVAFLTNNAKMDKGAFEMAVNRMFLDRPEERARVKRWKEVQDLLLCANSAI